jgi:hypothetical protein
MKDEGERDEGERDEGCHLTADDGTRNGIRR